MSWATDDDMGSDLDESSEDDGDTIPCPYCRCEIDEDSQHCPHCGNFISSEDTSAYRRPIWFIVTAIVCLAFVVMWIFNR